MNIKNWKGGGGGKKNWVWKCYIVNIEINGK